MATPQSNVLQPTGNAFIDGLVQGSAWQFGGGPRTLTYALTINDTTVSDESSEPLGGRWSEYPAIQAAVDRAFDAWEAVANISFVNVPGGGIYFDSTADLAVTLTWNDLYFEGDDPNSSADDIDAASLAFFPDPVFGDLIRDAATAENFTYTNPEGDLFFDNELTAFYGLGVADGGLGYTYILHEIGHALGLKHPFDNGQNGRPTFAELGIASYDTPDYTIMGEGAITDTGTVESGYAASPMLLDILAIQALYGANTSYNAGNTVYTLHYDDPRHVIWDGGGTDTLDASQLLDALTLDLRPATMMYHKGILGGPATAIAYNVVIENVIGTPFDDIIHGNDAGNVIDGGSGEEAVQGDQMFGHGGDDTYIVDSLLDTATEQLNEGTDRVMSSVTHTLGAHVEHLELTGLSPADGTGNTLPNNILGNGAVNVLTGNAGNDTLEGGDGADTLLGGVDDDRISGNGGNDSINGGGGIDTADYSAAGAAATVELWKGTAANDGQGGADTLQEIENVLGGGFNDVLVGNEAINMLNGANGNDTLLGGGGADTLLGGANDDRLAGNAGNDSIEGGAGTDTADYASAGSGVTVEVWKGTAANDGQGGADTLAGIENAVGGGFNDLLVGNEGANRLEGVNGNDTLLGGGGADTLLGGANDDRLSGNAGNDTLDGSAGTDTVDYVTAVSGVTVELWKGTAANDGQGGADVLLNVETVLGGGFNDLLVGNESANTLSGWTGNDTLLGGGGADTLLGGSGNDTLDGGTGMDTADFGAAGAGVTVELWKNTAANDGQGGADVVLNVETVLGSGFNDLLVGNESVNTLSGSSGNDTLLGGGGADTLVGGSGNDTLDGGTGTDTSDYGAAGFAVTVELWKNTAANDGQGGEDVVLNVETVLGGGFNDLLVGNESANTLSGGGGNDRALGGGGADTLIGGSGNDTLDGGTGTDAVDYGAAGTAVTVELWKNTAANDGQGGADVVLNVETVLGGGFNDLLVGNESANALSGGGGNDTMLGGGGADTLLGGAGIDVLTGNGGADQFVFDMALGASNIDQLTDFVPVDDQINLDDAIFTQIGGVGPMTAERFVLGATAGDADDRILYDQTNGALYYDSDGSGENAAVQFASLTGNPVLAAADFFVI